MSRAYLRLDPAFDERKAAYPDGPYSALIATFCQAELQPERGWFRSEAYLRAVLARRGRHVRYLIEHGDLLVAEDGRLYVDGWEEWQEGDWKVGERLERIRARRGEGSSRSPGAERTARWRARKSHGSAGVTDRASQGDSDNVSDRASHVTVTTSHRLSAGGGAGNSAGRALTADRVTSANGAHRTDDPYDQAIAWLAGRKAWIRDGSNVSVDLARMVDRKGADVVIAAMAAVPDAEDAAQFVYGARNALFPLGASVVETEPDPADVKRQLQQRRGSASA